MGINILLSRALAILLVISLFVTISSGKKKVTSNGIVKQKLEITRNLYNKYLNNILYQPIEELILIDLDLDGMPELFGGSYSKNYSPINFAITSKEGTLKELSFTGDKGVSGVNHDNGHTDIGIWVFSEVKLYRNKNTNKLSYIGRDIASRSYEVGSGAEYEISLNSNNINAKEIFYNEFNDEYSNNYTLYRYMKKDVSKSEYDAKHNEYYNDLQEVTTTIYKENINLKSKKSIEIFLDNGFSLFHK